MHKLSVVVITYNEEKNLGRCLDSVAEIADEILIVDSHSTDKTIEIARAKSARVILHTFEGHVAQKNYAFEQAVYDFVLSLDADEVLDEMAQQEIQALKSTWQGEGYILRRRNNYCGTWIRYGGWYPDKKLRLVNRKKGSWQGRNPHDLYKLQTGVPSQELQGHILHYTLNSLKDHIDTINSFSGLAAQAKYESGAKASLFKILFAPLFKFIKGYFFQLGFLDGYHGFMIAVVSSYASFLRYAKLRELQKEGGR